MITYWVIFVVVGTIVWFLFYKDLLFRPLLLGKKRPLWMSRSQGRFIKKYMNKYYWPYTKERYKRLKEQFLHPP